MVILHPLFLGLVFLLFPRFITHRSVPKFDLMEGSPLKITGPTWSLTIRFLLPTVSNCAYSVSSEAIESVWEPTKFGSSGAQEAESLSWHDVSGCTPTDLLALALRLERHNTELSPRVGPAFGDSEWCTVSPSGGKVHFADLSALTDLNAGAGGEAGKNGLESPATVGQSAAWAFVVALHKLEATYHEANDFVNFHSQTTPDISDQNTISETHGCFV
ncbi:hypothetical protein OROMI_028755 [Orobanche minor]